MRRRQLAAAAAAGIVMVAGGGVAYAQAQGSSGSYRTAAVTVGDVDQTLALSGTIAASARQDLSFGADGTVKKVTAATGDTVAAGDVLATLDPTDLETAVTKARATWAKAKAQLESDQTSQASIVTAATTPASSGSSSSSKKSSTPTSSATPTAGAAPTSTTVSPALTAALKTLADQQSAVTTAQTAATEAIAAAKAALVTQTAACAVTTEDPVDATAPADGTEEAPDESATTGLSKDCTTALDAVQSAQDVVAQKQDTLQTALQALSTTLTAAVMTLNDSTSSGTGSTTPSTPTTTPTESSDSSTSSGSSGETPAATSAGSTAAGSTGAGGATGGGGTVTAATLAQDQAAIDTAKAELTEARRALKAATLTAPFAGEILSVSVAKGDSVASSDVVIVIKGDGGTTVATTVTLDQIDDVERGQTASVTPAGASEPVTGTVTSIGLLPDSSTDTSTYPVTIDLDADVAAPEGATASVQLVIGTAKDALTVPSSAVSTAGRTVVSVLTDGQPVLTPVTVGVVGATRTSITEGLKDGQEVVLADLDAALPSGDSTTTRLPGAGGGFGGGGMPAGMTRPGGAGGARG